MEVPLTPLEFMRRTRRLYANREGVVDGALRWTYGEFFDRCDRWSAALQRLGVKTGRSRRLHCAEHARATRIVLRGAAARRGPRADQLPAGRGRLSIPDSAQRRHGGVCRSRSHRGGRFDSRRTEGRRAFRFARCRPRRFDAPGMAGLRVAARGLERLRSRGRRSASAIC